MFISFRKSPPSRLITPLPSRIQDIEEGIHFLHKSSSFNSLRGQLLCQHTHMQTSCHRMTQNLGSKTYTHICVCMCVYVWLCVCLYVCAYACMCDCMGLWRRLPD